MNVLLRAGLRHHRRHALQTVLTLLGIAAGTALLVAMQGAQRAAERAFDQALAAVAGTATHTVTAGPAGIPVEGYVAVCRELGADVAPSIRAVARAEGRPERTVLRVLGVDPLADVGLRRWSAPGARPESDLPVGELMTVPGAFVATRALLQRLGLARGSELPVRVGGRPFVARCAGVLDAEPAIANALDDVLLVDVATAQEWTGRLDRVDRLDLQLDGVDVARALASVRTHLGPGVRIEPAGAQQGGLAQLARGFRINLTALSLLSLLVGAFLVHETMRLSVVARRPSFGVLRALGVRGAALGRAVAIESLLIGLCGSALGALAGAFGAQALLDPLVRTLNDHYATFSLQRAEVDPWLLAAGVLLGSVVATVAGLGPALAASRVNAREVLVSVPQRPVEFRGRLVERRIAWALFAIVVGAFLAGVRDVAAAYVGVAGLVVLMTAAVPFAMRGCLRLAARIMAPIGPFARYTARSALAARDHLAMPMAAMVLALATTIALATLVTSFRDSVAGWLAQVLPGDVYVSVSGGVDERGTPMLPAIAGALPLVPGVAATTEYHRTVLPMHAGAGEGEVDVVGVRPTATWIAAWPLLDCAGDDARGRAALADGSGAWVSEPLAFRWRLQAGDTLTVGTSRGQVDVRIAATYRDYGNERGEVLVGASWLAQHAAVGVTAFGFELDPGADAVAVVAAVRARAAAAGDQAIEVRAQRDLRSRSLQVFDRTFAITGVMRLLCLAVAFAGIYAAFAAMQLERGAEIGLLRCLGALPSNIGACVVGQTALFGVCAGVLALPLGALLGHVLAHVINRVSFGWTLVAVNVPWLAAAEALLLALLAAVLAGLQPAWRFARMQPADGLREA